MIPEREHESVLLAATDVGSGPPLVLLHAWAMSRHAFNALIAAFSGTRRVIALDLRGHGDSPKPRLRYDFETLADDVLETLGTLGVDRFSLLGWSVGSSVAVALATRAPQRVENLILVATAVPLFTQRDDFPAALPPEAARDIADGEQADSVGFRQFIVNALTTQPLAPHERAHLSEESAKAPTHAVLALLQSLTQADFRAAVKALRMPILLVHGADDAFSPVAKAQWVADECPEAHIAVLSNCGHAPFLEHPALFNSTLAEFLNCPTGART